MNTNTTTALASKNTLKDVANVVSNIYKNELSRFKKSDNDEIDLKDLQVADKVLYEDNVARIAKSYFNSDIDMLTARKIAYNVRRFFGDIEPTEFVDLNELESTII